MNGTHPTSLPDQLTVTARRYQAAAEHLTALSKDESKAGEVPVAMFNLLMLKLSMMDLKLDMLAMRAGVAVGPERPLVMVPR